MKKIIISLLVIILAVGAYLALDFTLNLHSLVSKTFSTQFKSTPEPSPFTYNPNHEITYSGWIPNWATQVGFSSLKKFSKNFDSVSPVWYEVNEDGTLLDKRPTNAQDIQDFTEANDIKLIPTIAMFDHELIAKVLRDQENLDRHVEKILYEVEKNNYDGIDLDYESTELEDKDLFFEFLEKLSDGLHDNNRQLVVTVLAKWGDDVDYPSLPQTREVQDWSKIAEYADEIRIMAYDYTFSKAFYPGPIAPIDWDEEILNYAVTKLPRNKIVLGIPIYSYEWWQDSEETTDNLLFMPYYFLNNNNNPGQARSYDYITVENILRKYSGEKESYQSEEIFRYSAYNSKTKKNENRVLIYMTREDVKAREDLAQKYNIKGVAYWRLGNENGLLFR